MVCDRLEKAGLRVCESKCEFMVPSVSYLGHQIDEGGFHPLADKVQPVVEAPSPKSGVSADLVSTARDFDATMEMAHTTLGENPPGLCRSIPGQNVSNSD